MNGGPIYTLIINNYDRFTDVEKIIADFFIYNKNYDDLSMKELSEKLYVSEASFTRFAKKIGLSGFREFKYKYTEEILGEYSSISLTLQEVINVYQEIINQAPGIIDDKKINKVAEMISEAASVIVVGIGNSGLVASEMEARFMRVGLKIKSVTDYDSMRMESIFQGKNSLVIGLSVSGTKEPVLFALKNSFNNGAKTILITSNQNAEYNFLNELIRTSFVEDIQTENIISPQIPLLIVIDILYNCFITNKKEKAIRQNYHKKTVDIISENKE